MGESMGMGLPTPEKGAELGPEFEAEVADLQKYIEALRGSTEETDLRMKIREMPPEKVRTLKDKVTELGYHIGVFAHGVSIAGSGAMLGHAIAEGSTPLAVASGLSLGVGAVSLGLLRKAWKKLAGEVDL